jgi:hypothetical protein
MYGVPVLVLALVITSAGCGPRPHGRLRSGPVVTETQSAISLSSSGIRLALVRRCQLRTLDVWCPLSVVARGECKVPSTIREQQAVACPRELDFRAVQISLRSPWGSVYSAMSDVLGFVEIPVDWSGTGVDPLAADAPAQLATGWLAFADDDRTVPLKFPPEQVERMLIAIGTATDTQYEVGAANERAYLSTELGGRPSLVPGRPEEITLTIKNSGPRPAYRVIARLRSGVDALDDHQLSFGRIDPGITKIRSRVISLPREIDERSALVVAKISYFNGNPLEAKKRFTIVPEVKPVEPPRGLALSCKLVTPEVAPGERIQIDCDVRNLGKEPANEVSVAVSAGSVVSKNLAPKLLPGGGTAKLDLIGLTSVSEQQGAVVPVRVRVGALGHPMIEETLSARIASFAARCQSRLSRDDYKQRRKRLQAALDSGALTQKDFDRYDADYINCLE